MSNFILKFLWLEKSVAVGLDQKIGDRTTPVTEFFFWPQHDAWEEMKNFLEDKPWIDQSEVVILLNQITEVINYWQEKTDLHKRDVVHLTEKFPNVLFVGFD